MWPFRKSKVKQLKEAVCDELINAAVKYVNEENNKLLHNENIDKQTFDKILSDDPTIIGFYDNEPLLMINKNAYSTKYDHTIDTTNKYENNIYYFSSNKCIFLNLSHLRKCRSCTPILFLFKTDDEEIKLYGFLSSFCINDLNIGENSDGDIDFYININM